MAAYIMVAVSFYSSLNHIVTVHTHKDNCIREQLMVLVHKALKS